MMYRLTLSRACNANLCMQCQLKSAPVCSYYCLLSSLLPLVQVAVLYYKKRLRRILPAYLCSLVLAAAVVLLCRVGTPKHSYAVEIGRYFAATDLK